MILFDPDRDVIAIQILMTVHLYMILALKVMIMPGRLSHRCRSLG